MRRLSMLALALALGACRPSAPAQESGTTGSSPAAPAPRPIALHGTFTDGTPLTSELLRGKPWVVNLWLPG